MNVYNSKTERRRRKKNVYATPIFDIDAGDLFDKMVKE
jgi:hypothetical protein